MILVVSHQGDDHAAGVLGLLESAGHPVALLDTGQFPKSAAVRQRFGEAGGFQFASNGHAIDLSACGAGWWRRPQPLTLHDGLTPDVASFTYSECHEAMAGLWAALGLSWVNRPDADEVAHHKPYQLATALDVGLPIPKTLITNDPAAARGFIDEVGLGRVIYKTFLATEQHWRETRLVKADELALLERLRLAPVIFQEFVPAVADLRVTVVGDRIFATAITSPPNGYPVDYRMEMDAARFEPTELRPGTRRKIRVFMKRLGLLYGAIDLRRTPDGDEIFLEVNPSGEWLFVEERSEQPITAAMAALLRRLDEAHGG
jgi:glutathione synthase/RimK-type ligase-like ATP-grasp enzyme